MFFPTLLLWFIAYITLFLRPSDISNRTRISVTILLVLVALVGSINGDIPRTSYYKFIDAWFMWYITNIFLITCFHVFMEYYYSIKETKSTFTIAVQPADSRPNSSLTNIQDDTIRPRIDHVVATVLFIVAILFNIIYFTCST